MQRSARGRTWAMFMVAGGHFAGSIVRVAYSDEEREDEEARAGGKAPRLTLMEEVLLLGLKDQQVCVLLSRPRL